MSQCEEALSQLSSSDWYAGNFESEFLEEGEYAEEKTYIPVEISLEFSNGRTLQMACISYRIDHSDFSIHQAHYDLFGQMLINCEKNLRIVGA